MSSSGTNVAGTVTKDLFEPADPIITPVLRDPLPELDWLLPPRSEVLFVLMILVLVDLVSCLEAGEFFEFEFEAEFPPEPDVVPVLHFKERKIRLRKLHKCKVYLTLWMLNHVYSNPISQQSLKMQREMHDHLPRGLLKMLVPQRPVLLLFSKHLMLEMFGFHIC